MKSTHMENKEGLALALLSFCLTLVWVITTRPLNTPDEPAHLQAIAEIQQTHKLPEVHVDYSRTALGDLGFTAGSEIIRGYARSLEMHDPFILMPYESMQPPLYYVAAAIASAPADGNPVAIMYISRIVAALFGAGTVFFVWAATRQFAPEAPVWALSAGGLVMLMPQVCFNSASASNDSAANFAAAAGFYVWFRGLRDSKYDPWLLKAGALVGLGILAKLTTVALVPGLGVLWLVKLLQRQSNRGSSGLVGYGMWLTVGAGAGVTAVCGWWLVRNYIVYQDLSGSSEAFKLYRNYFQAVDFSNVQVIPGLLLGTWSSTWGIFGWMSRPLPDTYQKASSVLSACLILASAFTSIYLTRRRAASVRAEGRAWVGGADPINRPMIAIMLVVSIALIASFVLFNGSIGFQPQGRYLFPMMVPASLLFTGACRALPPTRMARLLAFTPPVLWLVFLNAVGLVLAAAPRIFPY